MSNCPLCNHGKSSRHLSTYDDRYGYPGKFNIHRCKSCHHLYLIHDFSDEEIQNLYSNYYPRANLEIPHKISKREKNVVSWWLGTNNKAHHFVKPGSKVLDIGCGMGESLLEMKLENCEAYGIDADKNFQKSIDFHQLNGKVGLFKSGLYPDNSFDYVIMDQLIEHLEDPISFLKDVFRVLKPGGRVIISTPNFNGLNIWLCGQKSFMWHAPYHLQFFSKKTFSILTRQAGFTLEKSFTKTNAEWLFYQQVHLFLKPKEGQKSSFFYPWDDNRSRFQNIVIGILLAFHLIGFNHTVIRLADLFNFGNNAVYILKKTNV